MSSHILRRALDAFVSTCVRLSVLFLVCVAAPIPAALAQGTPTLKQLGPALEQHLRQLFENPKLRVTVAGADTGMFYAGDKVLGSIALDDEDIAISVVLPAVDVLRGKKLDAAKVQTYLRTLFGSSKIKAAVNDDDVDVELDGEYVGTVFYDETDGPAFVIAILTGDLPETKRNK